MNTGIFGEGFPYSNFHDLNMDWIIKIAKDFLDQYSHIQQVITDGEQSLLDITEEGLNDLQEKADNLQTLLQEWYDTHSADIANELEDALEDISDSLQTAITNFNTAATNKGAEVIASIPADYTALSAKVTTLENVGIYYKGYLSANDDFNDYQEPGIYQINLSQSDYNTLSHAPSYSMLESSVGLFLEVIHNDTETDSGMVYQKILNSFNPVRKYNSVVRYGVKSGANFVWGDWFAEIYSVKVVDDLLDDLEDRSILYKGYMVANDDFNTYQEPGIYQVNLLSSDYATIQHAPSLSLIESSSGLFLEVIHNDTRTNYGMVYQKLLNSYNPTRKYNSVARYGVRSGDNFVWGDWFAELYSVNGINTRTDILTGGAIPFAMNSEIRIPYIAKAGETFAFVITSANFNYEGLTNIYFDAELNGSYLGNPYVINRPTAKSVNKLHVFTLPYDIDTLVLKTNKENSATITSFSGIIRIQQAFISKELTSINAQHIIRVGSNKPFTSLLEGIIEAEKYKNSIVYVDPGTYNMTSEFKTKYGNDYFTTPQYYGKENYRGCPLTNGIHVIGIGGNVIVTGGLESTDNASALNWWSIFSAGDDTGTENGYGFTLENLTIKAITPYLRYLIHDEYGGVNYNYINRYINCRLILTGSTNVRCIGGGLGQHGYIEIIGCSISAPNYTATTRGINYHNNDDGDSVSVIYVRDCYIPNGTVGITWYGETEATKKSVMYVSGCYLQHAPIKQAETQESTIENVDIVAWNNYVPA